MIVAWLMAGKLPFWHRQTWARKSHSKHACCWVRDLMTETTTEQAGPLGGKLIRRTNCFGRGSNVEKINSISQMANRLVVADDFEGGNRHYVHRHRMISFGVEFYHKSIWNYHKVIWDWRKFNLDYGWCGHKTSRLWQISPWRLSTPLVTATPAWRLKC